MSGGTWTKAGRALLCCHKHAGAGRLAGELPEEARTDTTGRLPWAPANAASKHGWFTPRAMRRAKPVTGQCRSARRRMRATSLSGMCCGLAAAGSIESSPTFPPGVFYLGLTSPPASHVSRNRAGRTPTYSQPTARVAHLVPYRRCQLNSFCPTFRYRGMPPTESACGRDPCRRECRACNLLPLFCAGVSSSPPAQVK
ncbi:hypothetical protein BGLA2_930005 [Burkholderia gladioli]|nr:hypothetical protein BGLA2_930005 [Burkholderia gladioli]